MGFDLFGKSGNYFRNSIWLWHPLWQYVCNNCRDILTEEEILHGHFNEHYNISKEKAEKIGEHLLELLRSDESVSSTGLSNNKYPFNKEDYREAFIRAVRSQCNDPDFSLPDYQFDEENVRRFAYFCLESEGFTIS